VSLNATKEATVIIPALNEEEGIKPTINEIKQLATVKEIIVVDGGSVDGTAEIAEKIGAHVLIEKNTGYGNAIYEGIKHLNPNAQYVIFIDADFTYPAEYIPKMIEILEKNPRVGMVIGNRFEGHLGQDNVSVRRFYWGNKLLAFTHSLLNGVSLQDPLSGMRIVRHEILKNWKPKSKGFDIEIEMNKIVEKENYKIAEFPIIYRVRLGEKKLKVRNSMGVLRKILQLGFEK
jgi:glycosyltransferase involved in cell wall biosynthesis